MACKLGVIRSPGIPYPVRPGIHQARPRGDDEPYFFRLLKLQGVFSRFGLGKTAEISHGKSLEDGGEKILKLKEYTQVEV